MAVTQAEINEATIIAKNAAYKLAYELALEAKYGGKVQCCMTKLKLLWLWANILSCQTAIGESVATIEITTCTSGDALDILVDGETIVDGPRNVATSDETTLMLGITAVINSMNSEYKATFDASIRKGIINLTGPCDNPVLSVVMTGADPVVVYEGFSDGYCAAKSCLTEAKIKSLISKVRAMCTA